jgi:hypothetical protein
LTNYQNYATISFSSSQTNYKENLVEKLRADCQLCTDPIGGRPILKEGALNYQGERIQWVVIPSRPSSVTTGQHLVFTTVSHHVESRERGARSQLMQICLNLGWEMLGENFRMALNQGPEASSFEHFHAHLIAPGPDERFVSLTTNIPDVLDQAVETGSITTEAANAIKERVFQRAR